uniref:Cytoplasmic protein n=1 Tax=uncultured Armatimonadetes bacterium TaxID=157466 RepID=A0A6J4I640_9BACT|nr:FIG074102: hypothetical protein [uncultured Armatimonadetes bacterium]
MRHYENETEFAGKRVADWDPGTGIQDPETTIYRLRLDWDDEDEAWTDRFAAYLNDPRAAETTGLVVGAWDTDDSDASSEPIVEALVSARDRLPNLSAIYLGDIVSEENEISWIQQSDVSPLFDAYPNLTHFRVRGGTGLSLGTPRHANLRSLIIESGGLPANVLHEVAAAEFPALEHLEIWLGTESYGAEATVEDLAPILDGSRWPNLRYLGLRDSDLSDQIAAALAGAPVLERLETLDLSLGTLGDEGAAALAANPAVARLKKLDIHYHYVSEAMVEKLKTLGIAEVDADEPQKPDTYGGGSHRYVAVGE